eukprot:scaffold166236_cov33-Tisochrysis_lutea.AAC.2
MPAALTAATLTFAIASTAFVAPALATSALCNRMGGPALHRSAAVRILPRVDGSDVSWGYSGERTRGRCWNETSW